MNKGQMHILIGIIYEYDNLINISDYDFKIGGKTLLIYSYFSKKIFSFFPNSF